MQGRRKQSCGQSRMNEESTVIEGGPEPITTNLLDLIPKAVDWRVFSREEIGLVFSFKSLLCFCVKNPWKRGKSGRKRPIRWLL